jgi:hypothetical protein
MRVTRCSEEERAMMRECEAGVLEERRVRSRSWVRRKWARWLVARWVSKPSRVRVWVGIAIFWV